MSHKNILRQRIRQQMDEYLAQGGRVRKVEPGASGADLADPRQRRQHSFSPRVAEERTPVPHVIAAIEARKQAKRVRTRSTASKTRKPRRRLVYDDFGEPLRWEWIDD